MKNQIKLLGILCIVAGTMFLSSCGEFDNGTIHCSSFTKSMNNLYKVTYDKYDINYALDAYPLAGSSNSSAFGCSAVSNGNYFGHSFDYTYTDSCELVVEVPADKGRFASIGVAGGLPGVTEDSIRAGLDDDTLNLIPLCVVDGINEKGVACAMNVVPAQDLSAKTTGSAHGKTDLNMECMVRFVLDYAATAVDAVNMLNERNVYIPRDYFGITAAGYELHLLVADKKETYLIEFVDNDMNYIHNSRIMTNFYQTTDKTGHSSGIERYNILNDGFKNANTYDGMIDLLEQVQYTKGYTSPLWYSDFVGTVRPDDTIFNMNEWQRDVAPMIQDVHDGLSEMFKTGENPLETWITMHMSVFDLESQKMRVIVHEKYDDAREFYVK